MADIVSTVAATIALAKTIYETGERMKGAELKERIATLREQLVDLKSQAVDLKEENQRLRDELAATNNKSRPEDRMEIRNGMYYFRDPRPGEQAGPYCTACFSGQKNLIALTRQKPPFDQICDWRCPACRGHYNGGI